MKRNPTKSTLSKSCLQTAPSQRQTWSWPAQRRKREYVESKRAGSRKQIFPGAMPNAPVMPKILIWVEMLGSATLLPKQTLSGLLISSVFLSNMGNPSSLPTKRGSYCSTYQSALRLPETKHQVNTIMTSINIRKNYSSCIIMRIISNCISAHCTFRVQPLGFDTHAN